MRTQQEILDRIAAIKADDIFGFQSSDLIAYLDFEHAKPFINAGVTAEEWGTGRDTRPSPADAIKSYMAFAWDKANNCRGLSAGRSVEHMKSWLWLDGKDELAAKLDGVYEYYGKPCLYLVCKEYGIEWTELDNDHWTNDEDSVGLNAGEAIAAKLGDEELVRAYT